MTDLQLSDKVALVTGAAGGIGQAMVHGLLREGARVAGLDLQASDHTHDPEVWTWLQADVSRPAEVERAVERVAEHFGGLDVVVHGAGIARDAPLWKLSDEDWRQVVEVNLTGSFHVLRAVTPVMREHGGGAIVLVSSIHGLRGRFGQANYAASKAGVVALARTAALELAAFGIRVNVVAPGLVETPMTQALPEVVRLADLERTPMGSAAQPEDVADAALFLCSPRSRHVTGVVLRVDGGQCIG